MPGSAISRGIRAELVREFALRALIMFLHVRYTCFFVFFSVFLLLRFFFVIFLFAFADYVSVVAFFFFACVR